MEKNIDNNNLNSKQPEIITPDYIQNILYEMLKDPNKLSKGHKTMAKLEVIPGFYLSLLNISLNITNYINKDNNNNKEKAEAKSLVKMSSTILLNYLTKNWNDENYIQLKEKMEIFSLLSNNIEHNDYYLKNFIAKLLGLIAAKEWPNSYEMLIKKVLKALAESNDDEKSDIYLRIMIRVLDECDDKIATMTSELIPVIIECFKKSTVSY